MAHEFGGAWTELKLIKLKAYLQAWAKVMSNQDFTRIYVDAFAGTGDRTLPKESGAQLDWLPHDDDWTEGSARIALGIRPDFQELYLVEKNARRYSALKAALTKDFPDRLAAIRFVRGDANEEVARLCEHLNWRNSRAVLFLDPYGLQVDWTTIEAVARTKAIDLWYLAPTGMGLGRLAVRNGQVPAAWAARIHQLTGDPDWRRAFYRTEHATDLFSRMEPKTTRIAEIDDIDRYFIDRLRTVFGDGVAPRGFRLGSGNRVMYTLMFACANPGRAARSAALRIANHLIGKR